MRNQGYGRIVQNSSVLGLATLAYRGAYVASKFALEGLTDTLRLELAGSGIQVSLIEPGPIESRIRANSYEKFRAHIDRGHSPHRGQYHAVEKRLLQEGPVQPFTLPPPSGTQEADPRPGEPTAQAPPATMSPFPPTYSAACVGYCPPEGSIGY